MQFSLLHDIQYSAYFLYEKINIFYQKKVTQSTKIYVVPVSLQLSTEAAAAIERERDCMDYVHDDRCANIWQSLLACKKPPHPPLLPGGILSPDGVTTSARGKSTRWHPLLFLINKKTFNTFGDCNALAGRYRKHTYLRK